MYPGPGPICVNSSPIAKQAANSASMALFDISKHGECFHGAISAYADPADYSGWTNDDQAPLPAVGGLLPKKLGALTSVAVGSHQTFLPAGSTIEIWGWNE